MGDAKRHAETDPRPDTAPAESAPAEPARTDPDPVLLRALADLDNVRKRYERRLATAGDEERTRVVSLWLPVVDDLERALQHADGDSERVIDGVRAVYEHARAVLERLGLERFEDVGKQFDPKRHDAVGVVDVDASPGSIVAAAQAGYASKGNTIRPARVVVASGMQPKPPGAQEPG
jgi:molecular chaperone GrpE